MFLYIVDRLKAIPTRYGLDWVQAQITNLERAHPELKEVQIGMPEVIAGLDMLPDTTRPRHQDEYEEDDPLSPSSLQGRKDASDQVIVRCWEDIGVCSPKPSRHLVSEDQLLNVSSFARQLHLTNDYYLEYLKEHLWLNGYCRAVPVSILIASKVQFQELKD